VRTIPVGVIDPVERLASKQQAMLLRNGKLLEQTDIPVLETGIVEVVSQAVANDGSVGGLAEQQVAAPVAYLEPLRRIIIATGGELLGVIRVLAEIGVLPEVRDVVSAPRPDAGEVIARLDSKRGAALELSNTGNLPAARDGPQQVTG